MASSGYLNTSNQYIKYWIEVITNSQSISNNTSNVTVKVWAKRTNTGYTTWGSGSVTLKVNGSYHNSGNKQIEITSTSKVYHSWTGNITHNADGTKKLTCSASINIPTVLSSNEQNYSLNLKTIPRTSSFTLSKSSCELGTSFTVNINRASSSFTHAVTFMIGGEKRYIQQWNNNSISPSYTPPITDAVYMSNSTNINVVIRVETYSGSTHIGSTTKNITLTCPSSLIPTFTSVSAVKVASGVDSNVTCLVQGYSKIKATIHGAKGIHGSTISKHYATIAGINYSGSTNVYTSSIITTAGDLSVLAKVSDSRGRGSGVKTTTIKVEPYSKPFASDVIVRRVNSDYNYNPEGIYIQVKATKNYSSLNGENTCVMYVAWRENKGEWSEEYELANNTNFNFNNTKFSTDKAYDVRIKIKDKLNTITSYYVVSTGEVTMDFKNGGKGVAIGKVSEIDNLFDVNFNGLFRKDITFEGGAEFKSGTRINKIYCDGLRHYNYTNGYLVTTNIPKSFDTMVELCILGNGYSLLNNIKTHINCYNNDNGEIIQKSNTSLGYPIDITTFYNSSDFLCFWFTQPAQFITIQIELYASMLSHKYVCTNSNIPSGVKQQSIIKPLAPMGIVDSGNNSNGEWIRYGDGTQICTKVFKREIEKFSSWGSIFESPRYGMGNWSISFKDKPKVVTQTTQTGFSAWTNNVTDTSSTSCGSITVARATQINNVTTEIVVVGIGRWK